MFKAARRTLSQLSTELSLLDPCLLCEIGAKGMARLNKDLEAARLAGDTPRMQALLGDKTQLLRAMYGTPA